MRFSRQEYWNELPFPSPGDLSNPGIEPRSPALQADALPSKPPGKPTPAHSGILAIKRDGAMPFADTWVNVEMITLSEVSQRKTNIKGYYLYVESQI